MFPKYLGFCGMILGCLALQATPASAQELTSAIATIGCGCGQSSLTISATGLTVGANYVVNYSVTATPVSGSPTAISSAFDFTAKQSSQTVKATIPLGRLSACATTGSIACVDSGPVGSSCRVPYP